uniref:Uncharacterized protein n=1 Tax=Utricularia reniformis TaxID=192314 RepID=A0A1Y0AZ40_9LAMI|nr:hypothetical protein AEK19_MT1572 [Utricularia reniformis]ART30389.1 hypothetical protein AEK19_MT1572 [Utricularia reniformis]
MRGQIKHFHKASVFGKNTWNIYSGESSEDLKIESLIKSSEIDVKTPIRAPH